MEENIRVQIHVVGFVLSLQHPNDYRSYGSLGHRQVKGLQAMPVVVSWAMFACPGGPPQAVSSNG